MQKIMMTISTKTEKNFGDADPSHTYKESFLIMEIYNA